MSNMDVLPGHDTDHNRGPLWCFSPPGPFVCGECGLNVYSVCALHAHMYDQHTDGSYHYDSLMKTSFPKYDSCCTGTQTCEADTQIAQKPQRRRRTGQFPKVILSRKGGSKDKEVIDSAKSNEPVVKKEVAMKPDGVNSLNECYQILEQQAAPSKREKTASNSKERAEKERRSSDYNNEKNEDSDDTIIDSGSVSVKTEPTGVSWSEANTTWRNINISDKSHDDDEDGAAFNDLPEGDDEPMTTPPRDAPKAGSHKKRSSANDTSNNGGSTVPHKRRRRRKKTPVRLSDMERDAEGLSLVKKICEKKVKTLTKPIYSKNGKRIYTSIFVCEICGEEMIQRKSHAHMSDHLGFKPYVCDVCGMSFPTQCRLRAHVRRHDAKKGIGKFKCIECLQAFVDKQEYLAHVNIHSGELPHKCDKCPAAFRIERFLKRHIRRVHDREKNSTCDACGQTFFSKSRLNSHYRQRHMDATLPCHYCGQLFRNVNTRRQHEMTHTGQKQFHCWVCERGFIQWTPFLRHMMRQHGFTREETKEMNKRNKGSTGTPNVNAEKLPAYPSDTTPSNIPNITTEEQAVPGDTQHSSVPNITTEKNQIFPIDAAQSSLPNISTEKRQNYPIDASEGSIPNIDREKHQSYPIDASQSSIPNIDREKHQSYPIDASQSSVHNISRGKHQNYLLDTSQSSVPNIDREKHQSYPIDASQGSVHNISRGKHQNYQIDTSQSSLPNTNREKHQSYRIDASQSSVPNISREKHQSYPSDMPDSNIPPNITTEKHQSYPGELPHSNIPLSLSTEKHQSYPGELAHSNIPLSLGTEKHQPYLDITHSSGMPNVSVDKHHPYSSEALHTNIPHFSLERLQAYQSGAHSTLHHMFPHHH